MFRLGKVFVLMLASLMAMGSSTFAAITMTYPSSTTHPWLWQYGNGTLTPTSPTTVKLTATFVPTGGGARVALGSNSKTANGGAWANHIGGGIWTSSGVYTYTASYYDFPTASTLKVENNPGIL
jgi:hypothetical protein